jgi:NADH-quinone oxidoreductase subunit L
MTGEWLKILLTIAWLLPLAGFAVEIWAGYWGTRQSKAAALLAVGCIATGFLCSLSALLIWGSATHWTALEDHGAGANEHHALSLDSPSGVEAGVVSEVGDSETRPATGDDELTFTSFVAAEGTADDNDHHAEIQTVFSGTFYTLGKFGPLEISLDWYIDSLTLVMFTMVTLIATCIHVFAMGYMSDELTDDYVDHQIHNADGSHFHRPGRYYRFFAFMSLFCFSMLGLVLSGNLFQVFVFWELVGICSYLLIGFYVERKTASDAANKAFIMNRVGDFGFLIGLMVIWTYFGTFRFDDTRPVEGGEAQAGLYSMVERDDHGNLFKTEDGQSVVLQNGSHGALTDENGQSKTIPYTLLIVAGLGVFGGCIGKSAQFPLQTWLPDAMEGPTPVSALVHSATMVAAGVYFTGRFFPMFTPEVLLTIAYIGCITLFIGATIAMVATDIKKVLAYSTISQLGYMMLGLGVFGWGAGLFHLFTHAFFKSLMFLSSGSVIYSCHHEQEMPKMGGLLKKMPITGITMLIGVIAISGLSIPGTSAAFSGFHSKDEIVATAMAFIDGNPMHFLLFFIPLVTAGLTAFYMFRLWFYTFWGKPRDQDLYDHAHESPLIMTGPLVVLAFFAMFCAGLPFLKGGLFGNGTSSFLYKMLAHSEPTHVASGVTALTNGLVLPSHDAIHAVHSQAGAYATILAFSGTILAYILYGTGILNPAEIRKQFAGLYSFLVDKWRFDELYDIMFVRPMLVIAKWATAVDKYLFDGILHGLCKIAIGISKWDRLFDEKVVDGMVNFIGDATFATGKSFRIVQTGKLRQYIMFIAVGVLALFAMMFVSFPK